MMQRILQQSARTTIAKGSRNVAGASVYNGSLRTVPATAGVHISRRFNSSNVEKNPFNVDPFNDKDFNDIATSSTQTPFDVSPSLTDGSAVDAVSAAVVQAVPPPPVNEVIQAVMQVFESIHTVAGVPYWGSICMVTIGVRVLLWPLALKAVQGAAKMANLTPHMQALNAHYTNLPEFKTSPDIQKKYQSEMYALYAKHGINPARAMLFPLAQMPVFMSMFFGLRAMGDYYPDFHTGGALWFPDLAVADATLGLPILNALSFLAMIEAGPDGKQKPAPQQKQMMIAMRCLAVMIVPMTMDMPSGLFVYWCFNNVLSLTQTLALKNPAIKKALNIPDVVPYAQVVTAAGVPVPDPMEVAAAELHKEQAAKHSAKAHIIDGLVHPTAATPTSFVMPPREARVEPAGQDHGDNGGNQDKNSEKEKDNKDVK